MFVVLIANFENSRLNFVFKNMKNNLECVKYQSSKHHKQFKIHVRNAWNILEWCSIKCLIFNIIKLFNFQNDGIFNASVTMSCKPAISENILGKLKN